ncbi:hypothetical protein STAFG_6484 [Streptomyces afghaniensis 772]|uniref:Uncharacterized protein n=1 Tax=Streptomyces afghaniensis 772 TaxID=1283301 RepID=S4MS89_9ACTN|nr:hypothetical protein STAFG_6484 [Streptomyces afghaniensis 772]
MPRNPRTDPPGAAVVGRGVPVIRSTVSWCDLYRNGSCCRRRAPQPC